MLAPCVEDGVHLLFGFILNLFAILSADHEFQLITPTTFSNSALLAVSLYFSYRYTNHAKTYDIFNYEEAFLRIGGDYRITQMDRGVEFFNDLLEGFVAKYPGITFRWKLVEAPKCEVEVTAVDKFKEAFHRNFMPDSYSEL